MKENKLNSRLVMISGLSVLPEIKRVLEESAYRKSKTLVGLFREEIIPMYLKKERREENGSTRYDLRSERHRKVN